MWNGRLAIATHSQKKTKQKEFCKGYLSLLKVSSRTFWGYSIVKNHFKGSIPWVSI